MENDPLYKHLLFSNLHHTLNQDLNKTILHPVEEAYYRDAVKLFSDMADIYEALKSEEVTTVNNMAIMYLIPTVIKIFNARVENYDKIIVCSGTKQFSKFCRSIEYWLKNFKQGNEIRLDILEEIKLFFYHLKSELDDRFNFETIDDINKPQDD